MMFSSQLDQGLRLQPLALAESGDGRGQEKSAKDALSLAEAPACRKPSKQASLRSVFLAGREEATPLGFPDKDHECGGKAATKPHQGVMIVPACGMKSQRFGFSKEERRMAKTARAGLVLVREPDRLRRGAQRIRATQQDRPLPTQ